ncbi:MAG: hypothetical protein ACLFQB_16035 [Chitinispirillaceae bacterium]
MLFPSAVLPKHNCPVAVANQAECDIRGIVGYCRSSRPCHFQYLPTSGQSRRLAIHPQIAEVAGDFTTLELLAVQKAPDNLSFASRVKLISEQLYKDLDHSAVSGVTLLGEMAKRSCDPFKARMPVVFTSLVGHAHVDNDPMFSWLGEQRYAIS